MSTQGPSTHRLSDDRRDHFTDLYQRLTKDVIRWLMKTAKEHGIRARAFDKNKAKTAAERAEWEAALQYATKLRTDLELKSPGLPENEEKKLEVTCTTELARQADELAKKGVRLSQEMWEILEQCIDLRTLVIQHYDYISNHETISDVWGTEMETAKEMETRNKEVAKYEAMIANNESHRFFRDVLVYIQDKLFDRKRSHAMRVHKALTEMQSFTDAIMGAWKQYRQSGQGLIQAVVITEAAVWGASASENKMPEQDKEAESLKNAYYSRLDALNVETDQYPELLAEIRGMLRKGQQDSQPKSTAETLQHHLELLHFPTHFVMENYRAMSSEWKERKEKCPIPGYPVDLTYVYPGNQTKKFQSPRSKGKRKLTDEELEEQDNQRRKKMKLGFDEGIQLAWKLMNELHLLHTYKTTISEGQDGQAPENQDGGATKDQDGQAPSDQDEQAPLGFALREENDPANFPEDGFSSILSPCIYNREISFTSSYCMQLLIKIYQLFDEQSCQENKFLQGQILDETFPQNPALKDYYNRIKSARQDHGHHDLLKEVYEDCCGQTSAFYIKQAMEQNATTTPAFPFKYTWFINDQGQEEFYVVQNGSGKGKFFEPTERKPINKIDVKSFPESRMDVNWWADTTEKKFYWSSQPQFVGFVSLRRRLLEYHADLKIVNDTLSFFTFCHLIQALKILEPGEKEARQDVFIFEHEHNWLTGDSPKDATEMLEVVRSRLPWDGKDYDFERMSRIDFPKPLETLWELIINTEESSRAGYSKFARELEHYYDKWQLREKLRNSSKANRWLLSNKMQKLQNAGPGTDAELSWEKMVDIFKKGLPLLPCGEFQRDILTIDSKYAEILRMVGQDVGCAIRENELRGDYNARLLYFILEDFKAQEDAHKPKGSKSTRWKKDTHLMKVKQYLKRKNQQDQERETERAKERERLAK